jgi:hypothetical protein
VRLSTNEYVTADSRGLDRYWCDWVAGKRDQSRAGA